MKNTLLGLALVIAISPGLALAQGPEPGNPGRDPQVRRERRTDFLARRLNLSDSQKQQAASIFDAAEETSKKLREDLKQAQEGLSKAVKTRATDEQIDQLARTVGTLVGQLAAIQTKASAKFRALLTEEQRQKFDQFPEPRAGMMLPGFAGGPPPGPGMGMRGRGFAGGPPLGAYGWNPPPGPPPPAGPPEPPPPSGDDYE
jgi:Spy/CpxP family protein refolding chaperone